METRNRQLDRIQERVEWVDSLRFLGIWAIYVGHFGNISGKAYPFVFCYHVPLFFFAAGFFATSSEKSILVYTREKFLQLIVPYFTFSLVALIYYSMRENWDQPQVIAVGKSFLLGIRNQIPAASLWFLPCLFIISVTNYVILKLAKDPIVPFAMSIGCWSMTQSGTIDNPLNHPSWFMNIDSAMYYWIFFAIGPLCYPSLNTPFASKGLLSKCVSVVFAIFSIVFTTMTYLSGNGWFLGILLESFPSLVPHREMVTLIYYVPMALIIIHAHILVAKAISHIPLLRNIGRETLTFCVTEHVFKDILSQGLAFLGLAAKLASPVAVLMYAVLILVLSYFTVVRFLVTYFPWLVGRINVSK